MKNNILPLPIVGANVFGRYPKISLEQTFNMMISDNAQVPTPGHKVVSNISNSRSARELYNSPRFNHMIAVLGDLIYIIDNNLAPAAVGRLLTSSGPVFIAENEAEQIAFADGLSIYTYNYRTDVFTTVPVDFRPVYIGYQDGYFISADGDSNQWRLSDPNNGNVWPPAPSNVGAIESKPDLAVATVPFNRQLFVFGKITGEIWYDTGAQLFPYQRNNFYSISYGCLSASSIATATLSQGKDVLCWVGSNEKAGISILISDGGPPQQISNDGINFKLDQLRKPEQCFGFTYRQGGHVFYQVTWISDNLTFLYDFNTQKFFTLTDHEMNFHIAKRVAFFNNNYYFLSFIDGNLYQLSQEFTNYNGFEIPRIRIFPHYRALNSTRSVIRNMSILLEEGEDKTVQAIDFSMSIDGGAAFGNSVRNTLNTFGNRPNKCVFWRLGANNDFIGQLRYWSKGRFVINGGTMEVYQ